MLDGVMEDVTDGVYDGVCDGVWVFGKDSFEECPLTVVLSSPPMRLGSPGHQETGSI